MRPPWVNFITENLVWFIGSVLLAVFVWVAAETEQNPVESRMYSERIPVVVAIDEGMLITNTPISSAQITLRTTTNVWENLQPEDIIITANVTGQPPGLYTVPLEVTFNSAQRIVIESLQPEVATIAIDNAAEILVPVVPDIRSTPPTGFEVNDIIYEPQEVLVSGIASQVDSVVAANLRLTLSNESDTFTRSYRLVAVDAQGGTVANVTLTPDTLDVTVNIQPGDDFREVFVVPHIIGEPADGYVVLAIDYDPQTVLVSGRQSELENLPATISTTAVDMSDATSTFTMTVPVDLPDGVYLPAEQNITVTVSIDALTSSRQYDNLPVQIQGLDEGLNAVAVATEVSIIITGPQPILETLDASDISIIADLSDLLPGNRQVALIAVVNREGLEDATISVLPPVLDVEITALTE